MFYVMYDMKVSNWNHPGDTKYMLSNTMRKGFQSSRAARRWLRKRGYATDGDFWAPVSMQFGVSVDVRTWVESRDGEVR